MTKEEKIKEAWCNQCPDEVDKNGWFNIGYCVNGLDDVEYWLSDNFFKRNLDAWDIDYTELDNGEFIDCKIRPKALQGIEDNNGWVNVESKNDLPKDSYNYWVFCSDGCVRNLKDFEYYENYIMPELEASHYQPIEKPLKPIY